MIIMLMLINAKNLPRTPPSPSIYQYNIDNHPSNSIKFDKLTSLFVTSYRCLHLEYRQIHGVNTRHINFF